MTNKTKAKSNNMDKELSKILKQNEELKKQADEFENELSDLKSKMATMKDKPMEVDKSMQFLSEEYDDFKSFKSSTEKELTRLSSKLRDFVEKIEIIDETIETIQKYSYQYNVKILGIPQADRKESAKDSVDLCLKLFKEVGVDISKFDLDIAHRVPSRNTNYPPPIICKFTRRIVKEDVMSRRSELKNVDLGKFGIKETGRIRIYDHLTPKTQSLFNRAKTFQKENNYTYCWTKNSNVLLKETEDSNIIRVTSIDVLGRLESKDHTTPDFSQMPHGLFPPGVFTSGRGAASPGYGRDSRPRTRSSYRQESSPAAGGQST